MLGWSLLMVVLIGIYSVRALRWGVNIIFGRADQYNAANQLGNTVLDSLPVQDDRTQHKVTWRFAGWTGVVFLYGADCRFCDENVSNWIDLAAFLRPRGVSFVALTLRDTTGHGQYWRDAGLWLTTYSVQRNSDLVRLLGLPIVPSTVVVSHGKMIGYFQGVLQPSVAEWIVETLKGHEALTRFSEATGL